MATQLPATVITVTNVSCDIIVTKVTESDITISPNNTTNVIVTNQTTAVITTTAPTVNNIIS